MMSAQVGTVLEVRIAPIYLTNKNLLFLVNVLMLNQVAGQRELFVADIAFKFVFFLMRQFMSFKTEFFGVCFVTAIVLALEQSLYLKILTLAGIQRVHSRSLRF